MSVRRAIPFVVAAAVAAAGCGEPEGLTREQFVQQANAICGRETRALAPLNSRPVRSAAEASERAGQVQRTFEREASELRRLDLEQGKRGDRVRDRLADLADRRADAAADAKQAADRRVQLGYLQGIRSSDAIGREFDSVAASEGLGACVSSAPPSLPRPPRLPRPPSLPRPP